MMYGEKMKTSPFLGKFVDECFKNGCVHHQTSFDKQLLIFYPDTNPIFPLCFSWNSGFVFQNRSLCVFLKYVARLVDFAFILFHNVVVHFEFQNHYLSMYVPESLRPLHI